MAHRTIRLLVATSWTARPLRNARLPIQSEEKEAVPAGARNLAGNGAQGPVRPAVILKAVRDHLDYVRLPLEVPGEQRARRRKARISATADCADRGAMAGIRPTEILRRSDTEVGVIGDFQRATAGAFGQPTLSVSLEPPGN